MDGSKKSVICLRFSNFENSLDSFFSSVRQNSIVFWIFTFSWSHQSARKWLANTMTTPKTFSYILFKLSTLSNSSSQHCAIPYSFPPSIWLRFFKSRVLSDWNIFEIMNIHCFWYRLNDPSHFMHHISKLKNLGNEPLYFPLLQLDNLGFSHILPSNVLKGFLMKRKELIVCSSFIVWNFSHYRNICDRLSNNDFDLSDSQQNFCSAGEFVVDILRYIKLKKSRVDLFEAQFKVKTFFSRSKILDDWFGMDSEKTTRFWFRALKLQWRSQLSFSSKIR